MTKSVTLALPVIGEMQAGDAVKASTWQDVIATQNYVWASQGGQVVHAVFDPYWTSLAYGSGGSSYHSVGAGTNYGMELNQVQGFWRFDRHEYNTTATAQGYRLQFCTYARNLTVACQITRLDTANGNTTSSTGLTGIVHVGHDASNSEWITSTTEFTPAQASRGGSTANGHAYLACYFEAAVPSSGTGYLHQISVRIAPITSGDNLPRGAI